MKKTPRLNRSTSALVELLEDRIAPATLVNPFTVTYQDIDGDNVTVKITQPLFSAANVGTAFAFSNGMFGVDNSVKQNLGTLDVTKLMPDSSKPLGISVTAHRDPLHGGNGHADIGALLGTNYDLGVVKVQGNLDVIAAGDGDPTHPGVAKLDVNSLGVRVEGLTSSIGEGLNSLVVRGDMRGLIQITGPFGILGNALVGGSLGTLGGGPAGIHASKIGKVAVRGNLFAGTGANSGLIQSDSSIASVIVRGSILGSTAQNSFSATIYATNNISYAEVDGDLVGGSSSASGSIFSVSGSILNALVKGSVLGGTGTYSGTIYADQNLGSITVGGDVVGGAANLAGGIVAVHQNITSVAVGGSLRGGSAPFAGEITTVFGAGKNIGSVFVGGDVVGGTTNDTGDIASNGDLTKVIIGGNLVGGTHDYAGRIVVQKNLGSAFIGNSLVGQAYIDSASIYAGVNITKVVVGDNMQGAESKTAGLRSGSIYAQKGTIGSVFVGGDLIDANILAGVTPSADNLFGTGTAGNADALVSGAVAVISKVIIKGQAAGLTDGNHHSAIEAKNITSLMVDGITYSHLDPTISFANGFTLDGGGVVTVREI